MAKENTPITLYAYLIETSSGGVLGFKQTYVISASRQDLEQEIRNRADCADAQVVIVPPQKWNPPELASPSEEQVGKKLQQIATSIQQSMVVNHLPKLSPSELTDRWSILDLPASGRVYLIVKIEGHAIKDYAATGMVCDLCGKPRKKTREIVYYSVGVKGGKLVLGSAKRHDYRVCRVCDWGGNVAFLVGVFLIVGIVALITRNFWNTAEIAVYGGMIGIVGSILVTGRFTRDSRVTRKAIDSRSREKHLWDEIRVITAKGYKNLQRKAQN